MSSDDQTGTGPTPPAENAAAPWPDGVLPPQVSGYHVLGFLGRGGMGVVCHARHDHLNRDVALKVIRADLADDPEVRARFVREARSLAAVSSPHVINVYDSDDRDGVLYISMELLQGQSLRDRLNGPEPPPPEEVVRIATAVAIGLGAIHEQGLVHRDVTPGNVWLGEDGSVKILDFGLARPESPAGDGLTRTGFPMGTPGYMSPEQADGERVDTRSDLFSLGRLIRRLTNDEPPPSLAGLVKRLTADRPEDRPRSAAEVAAALEGAGRPPRPRRRGLRAAAGLLLVAAVSLLAVCVIRPAGEGGLPPGPVKIQDLRVGHVGKISPTEGIPLGDIGYQSASATFDDQVSLNVDLSEPAHIFLLGFNFNGQEQLHWPADPTRPPPKVESLRFPPRKTKKKQAIYLEETDADGGIQAFGVVASRAPLPPYFEWKAEAKTAWSRMPAADGVYEFNDGEVYVLKLGTRADRGQVGRELDRPAEQALRELGRSLRGRGADAVRLIAFPVWPK